MLRFRHSKQLHEFVLVQLQSVKCQVNILLSVPVTEFTNMKLTPKVNRQIQDLIVIMTSNLPSPIWLKVIRSIT